MPIIPTGTLLYLCLYYKTDSRKPRIGTNCHFAQVMLTYTSSIPSFSLIISRLHHELTLGLGDHCEIWLHLIPSTIARASLLQQPFQFLANPCFIHLTAWSRFHCRLQKLLGSTTHYFEQLADHGVYARTALLCCVLRACTMVCSSFSCFLYTLAFLCIYKIGPSTCSVLLLLFTTVSMPVGTFTD